MVRYTSLSYNKIYDDEITSASHFESLVAYVSHAIDLGGGDRGRADQSLGSLRCCDFGLAVVHWATDCAS